MLLTPQSSNWPIQDAIKDCFSLHFPNEDFKKKAPRKGRDENRYSSIFQKPKAAVVGSPLGEKRILAIDPGFKNRL